MSATSRSSPYWVEEMASDGFIILCGRVPEGEGFIIFSTDPPRFVGLRKIPDSLMKAPFGGPLVAMASWMSGSLTEAAVRSKLVEAGLSASDIDAKLEWARQWATTITRQPRCGTCALVATSGRLFAGAISLLMWVSSSCCVDAIGAAYRRTKAECNRPGT